jgi:hypothetical protein
VLHDPAKDQWILFARRVHPVVHDAIMEAARRKGIAPKHAHDIITPQEAIHLVISAPWRVDPHQTSGPWISCWKCSGRAA